MAAAKPPGALRLYDPEPDNANAEPLELSHAVAAAVAAAVKDSERNLAGWRADVGPWAAAAAEAAATLAGTPGAAAPWPRSGLHRPPAYLTAARAAAALAVAVAVLGEGWEGAVDGGGAARRLAAALGEGGGAPPTLVAALRAAAEGVEGRRAAWFLQGALPV